MLKCLLKKFQFLGSSMQEANPISFTFSHTYFGPSFFKDYSKIGEIFYP